MAATAGTADQILSLPSGGGDVHGLGETFRPDLHTGTGSYAIPLDIPNGPGDIAPQLTLSYHTGAGSGPFGMGFGLPLLAIARSTDRRIPSYRDDDDTLILLGGGELVPMDGGELRLRVDDGGWQIRRDGDGFRLTDREGRVHRLGVSDQARLFTVEDGVTKVLRWQLEEISDALGNRATLTYRRDANQLYLDRVAYGPYLVQLDYEARPDPVVSGRAGFLVTTRLRCVAVELRVDDSPVPLLRRWQLGYEQSSPGGHSLLSEVTLTGFDEQGGSATLPVLRLGYTAPRPRRLERLSAELPGSGPGAFAGGRRELLDWEGDGLPDLIELGGHARVWRNIGDLTWARPESLPSLPAPVALDEPAVAFADMDGNGTADLVMLDRPLPGYYPHRPGGGFDRPLFWRQTPSARLSDRNARLVDLDGDGVVDLLVTGARAFTLFFRDATGGWRSRPQSVPRPRAPPVSLDDPRVSLADMNGDGLQDLVRVDGAGVTYWPYLGNGRWANPVTLGNPPDLPPRYDPARMFLADIDGDGCADLVYVDSDRVHYWLNQGGARLDPPHAVGNTPLGAPADVRLADMKGTGTPGVLWSSTSPGRRSVDHFFLDLTGGVKPYLLSRIDNGMGLVSEIDYGFSTEQAARDRRAGRPWETFLPFPLPVVTGVRSTDRATGRLSASSIRYHDGHFDGDLREFAGFARVEVEEAGDESTPALLTRNLFNVGVEPGDARRPSAARRDRLRALRGKLLRTEVYGLDGGPAQERPYFRTDNSWEVEPGAGAGTVAPRLRESRTSHFERRPAPFRVMTTRNLAFDAAGNVTDQEQRAEDPRDPGLTRVLRTTIGFAHDPAGRFSAKPARSVQRDAAGEVVATTVNHYDGLPEGQVGPAGLLTRIEALVLTDELVARTYGAAPPDFAALGYHRRPAEDGWWIDKATYTRTDDAGGLRGTTANALGRTTLLFFDAARTHPSRVVDALGNRTDAVVNHRANKLGSLTDANGATIANRYDPLGRLELVVEPGATEALPTVRHAYETGTVPPAVTTQHRAVNGQPGVIERTTFLDGAGAVLEERVVTAAGEVVERGQLYSARGLVREQFLPHLAPGPGYAVPAPGIPRRRLRYDAIGRLVEVENPDGSVQRQAFEPGVAVLSDEEDTRSGVDAVHAGTSTRHVYDPTGRIMEVVLDDGGTPVATRYRYDVKGNLEEVSDAAGSRASFACDLLGRRLRTDTPESGTTVFVFDADGNQVERRDARGAAVRFAYDELDRLVEVLAPSTGEVLAAYTYHDTATPPPPEAGPFTRGRPVKATSPGGETVYGYDALGQVTSKRLRPTGLAGRELAIDVAYRADGQRASVTYPEAAAGAGRRVVAYDYDERGLLERIPGFVKRVDHNAAGQRERVEYANGVVTTYAYDSATFRVTALRTVDAAGTALQDLAYGYDLVGNLLGVSSPDAGQSATYGYDDLYRLTSAATNAGDTRDYAYDRRDNLTFKSDVGVYAYDGAGRLAAAGPDAFAYTAAGQAETGPWGQAAYDQIGRLASIARGSDRQALLYDHDGRRVRAERTGPAGARDLLTPDDLVAVDDGIVIGFVFDGAARVAQFRADNLAVGFLHGDHLGSTTLVTGAAGQVLQRVRYDPFGAVLEDTVAPGAGGTPYLFSGQLWDDWSQLLQLDTRAYSPRLGRMLTPDALAPELYQPQAWNRYSYVQNNPLRYVDPTGHLWEEVGDWFEENWVSVVAVVAIALVVVLTIVTFGAAALVGVGILMALGGLVGGLAAAQAGGDILQGVLVGMAVGGAAGLAGLAIGAGMAAVFGAKTFAATVLTGTLAGAVTGGAMGFAAGYAGGQGSAGNIWDKVWKGALVGAVSGALFGVASWAFGGGSLGTGRLDLGRPSGWGGVQRVVTGFAIGSATEMFRQKAFGEETSWEAVLTSGIAGAALVGFVRFGGDSGIPVLNVLKPEQVGIASSIFAQATSAVFVLDYADDLWRFLAEHRISTAKGGQV